MGYLRRSNSNFFVEIVDPVIERCECCFCDLCVAKNSIDGCDGWTKKGRRVVLERNATCEDVFLVLNSFNFSDSVVSNSEYSPNLRGFVNGLSGAVFTMLVLCFVYSMMPKEIGNGDEDLKKV